MWMLSVDLLLMKSKNTPEKLLMSVFMTETGCLEQETPLLTICRLKITLQSLKREEITANNVEKHPLLCFHTKKIVFPEPNTTFFSQKRGIILHSIDSVCIFISFHQTFFRRYMREI